MLLLTAPATQSHWNKCSESDKPTSSQSWYNSPTDCCTFHRIIVWTVIAQNWKSIWIHRKKFVQFSLLKFYTISGFKDKYKAWHTFICGDFLKGRWKGGIEDRIELSFTKSSRRNFYFTCEKLPEFWSWDWSS